MGYEVSLRGQKSNSGYSYTINGISVNLVNIKGKRHRLETKVKVNENSCVFIDSSELYRERVNRMDIVRKAVHAKYKLNKN